MRTWDKQKLQENCLPVEVEVFCNTPISLSRPHFWAWHYDRRGIFFGSLGLWDAEHKEPKNSAQFHQQPPQFAWPIRFQFLFWIFFHPQSKLYPIPSAASTIFILCTYPIAAISVFFPSQYAAFKIYTPWIFQPCLIWVLASREAKVVFASSCCFRDPFGKRPTRVR